MIINHKLMQMLMYIDIHNEISISDLVKQLHISQPLVSRRIYELKKLKLIKVHHKDNKNFVYYVIDNEQLVNDLISIYKKVIINESRI